ncbi:MAG: DNA replication and repair protein RecF [Acidimicrobiia bacterium]|nr:DNA replication and repair protein RecF [Acidimicrobiia bacterium]
MSWAATARSLRGVPDAALVRSGAERAILRVQLERAGSEALVEAEIRAAGRNRVQLNRKPLPRLRDLAAHLRVTVFAPDDVQLVKGGPSERRAYLDDLLVAVAPRFAATRADVERIVRHRNTLLRGGVRSEEDRTTLAVFDEQLARAGGEMVRGRLRLVARLGPEVDASYRALAREDPGVEVGYESEWAGEDPGALEDRLREALGARRRAELERGVTLAGPHRDELRLGLGGLDARSHASQGEQRTLALALRLAGHRVCTDVVGEEPVLLLDDVFSELDPGRAAALVEHLPPGQTLLTSAGIVPDGIVPQCRLRVTHGRLEEVA